MINIKPARRQAYRYGQLMRGLTVASDDYLSIGLAWMAFLKQFENVESSDIVQDWLITEFKRGVEDFDPLAATTAEIRSS